MNKLEQEIRDEAISVIPDDGLFPNYTDQDIWIGGFREGVFSKVAEKMRLEAILDVLSALEPFTTISHSDKMKLKILELEGLLNKFGETENK